MSCDQPPHKRNWRLYYLLDLVPPITSKQVKWSFRKVTLRHHYYQAYLVLYNSSRRFLYDAAGEDAYGFISSGTWGPLIPVLGSTLSILFYCIFMLIEVALLIVFFALLGARVDMHFDITYMNVVAPLFVFTILAVLATILAMVVNFCSGRTRKEGMAAVDRISPVGNFLAAAAYLCAAFLFGIAVKDDPALKVGKYTVYMCTPIIGDVLYYATSLIWRWPRRIRLQMTVDNNAPNPFVYYGIFVMAFVNLACSVAQWIMIGQKIDGTTSVSWYIVFIPSAVRAAVRVVEALMRSLMRRKIGVRSGVGVAFDTLGSFFHNGLLIISLYFVAVRIVRGKEKCRMVYALIPVYLTLAYLFLGVIATLVILLFKNSRSKKEETRGDLTWNPPPERAEDAAGLLPPSTTPSDSNDGAPITSVVNKQQHGGWDAFDDHTASSAAFPEDVDLRDEEDFDEFYTDEEEELFPQRHSPREGQEPYYNDEEEEEEEEEGSFIDSEDVRRTSPRQAEAADGAADRDAEDPKHAVAQEEPRTERMAAAPAAGAPSDSMTESSSVFTDEDAEASNVKGDHAAAAAAAAPLPAVPQTRAGEASPPGGASPPTEERHLPGDDGEQSGSEYYSYSYTGDYSYSYTDEQSEEDESAFSDAEGQEQPHRGGTEAGVNEAMSSSASSTASFTSSEASTPQGRA